MVRKTTKTSQLGRIVLIEDNPDHGELMKRALGRCETSSEVISLVDGQQALDYFFGSELIKFPDLILLDLKLPKIDGWQVLQQLKSSAYASVPVIILSSSSDIVDVTRAAQLHANSYVSKPLKLQDYFSLARDLVAYWLGWNLAVGN